MVALVLVIPLFTLADVLNEPLFDGALGRAAYSIPTEFVRHTSWKNELRFSFPPDMGFLVKNFVARNVSRAHTVLENVTGQAVAFAVVSVAASRMVAENVQFGSANFKAQMYAVANESQKKYEPQKREPEVIYVEQSLPDVPRCSRATGLAHYMWCRASTAQAF